MILPRRTLVCSLFVFIGACASIAAPPGGPVRTTPPALIGVTPDSGAVNFSEKNVVFTFDDVVSDRSPTASGDLEALFLVSPSDGEPRVSWHRERIEVRPRRGFRPNTSYSVTMLPGIADLRGNVSRVSKHIVFSTGPTISAFAIHGRAFDWLNERPAPGARIEALRLPDSLPYVGAADSTGQFAIGPLEQGRYRVRAILDANSNRALDPAESWDTLSIVVQGASPFIELLMAPRDTIAPRLMTVQLTDSTTISASFDRPLDPLIPLTPASFRVVGIDSSVVRVKSVQTRADAQLARARRDSVARVNAPRDTSAARDTSRNVPPAAQVPGESERRASGAVIPPKPSRPGPTRDVVITLDSLTPLRAGKTYRITAVAARGLLGQIRTSDRVVTVPLPRATPPDTTRTPQPASTSPAPARPPS